MLAKNLVGLLLALLTVHSNAATIQKPGLTQSATSKQRADEIKAAYRTSYSAYLKYASNHDALLPLTNGFAHPFGGWGASVVDSLSTSFLMGHTDLYNAGVEFSKKIDFTKTSSKTISLFETNIRYLAGLISAYELGGKKEQKLIDQAKVVGDHLVTGWLGENPLPCNKLKWNKFAPPDACTSSGIAETGTLILEMDRLSKYTGDPTYLKLAKKTMKTIAESKGVFPGLFAQVYNPVTGQPTDDYVTWGGGSDSFFEYLIKYAYLIGDDKDVWIPTWVNSVASSIEYLVEHPEQTKEGKLTYLTDYSESRGGNLPRWSHLGCFAGGNWILGAKMIGQPTFNKYGQSLTAACANTYSSSPSGIGPESFVFIGQGNNTNRITIKNAPFYREHGFDFEVTEYVLRPEVMESVFYAYRTTGDAKWQEIAWNAWQSIYRNCLVKQNGALAALANVNSTNPTQLDDSESFLYAETFKYLYLIFADPETANLDRYVFNTEAHPFLVDKPEKKSYAAPNVQVKEPAKKQGGMGKKEN
ncbi:related to Mannosyl-oligosaccharide alpha-1,2-mannosidase precursor [Ustilago bromivora]|uniref:alpha-1,2-Mannosidase n=1 Tax=Ustilago bromivora TaxID=307758 RepID=A0A1K0H275_9BASI|nr:related to Mannosyl-oligosaccharide alpha-1,2-mannosidase precursor [Ustilago bromivora]SYW77874.1 related to Mannosyl-oligosaccharide alpha-1,2-mannosidase precursor [Ustilago bromivora]